MSGRRCGRLAADTSIGCPATTNQSASGLSTRLSVTARNVKSTSADVSGTPSDQVDTPSQMERVFTAVRRHFPGFGEPRFQFECRAVDARESRLQQRRHDHARFVEGDEAVERFRIRPDPCGELSTMSGRSVDRAPTWEEPLIARTTTAPLRPRARRGRQRNGRRA